MDSKALHSLTYGLFVLTAKEGERDNGCIINTLIQVANTPDRVSIAVNKANYTHDMVKRTGVFNVSVLSVKAKFDLFRNFGFQSGRVADKFSGFKDVKRSRNGLYYITDSANAYLSCKVTEMHDLGSHTLFVAEITDGEVLSGDESVTYSYYFKNIKPAPQPKPEVKKGWVCSVCGYVYEGEELPADVVCPVCKHPASDFVKLG